METIDYDHLVTETSSAWLLEIDEDRIWFPKSECSIDEDEHTLTGPEWLLTEKGVL